MAKTLTDLLTLVGYRYERNNQNQDSDLVSRTNAINEAQREMALELGDMCWFLQRVDNVAWTANPGFEQVLPLTIQRLLYIEDPIVPGKTVPFRGNGIDNTGALKIILDRVAADTFSVHYLTFPTDLVNGTDTTQVPDLYVDALVLGACKILAETSGSQAIFQNFLTMYQDRMQHVRADCWRRHGQRTEDQRVELDAFGYHDGAPELGPGWSYWYP